MRTWIAIVAASMLPAPALAQIGFDAPFGDHAVVQRDQAIPVRGRAAPGTTVTVAFNGATASGKAGADGRWRVVIAPQKAGGPYRLEARGGGAAAVLDDLMVGDVWLCSGQSNMEFTLRHATNADAEVAQSARPLLRLLNVPRQSSAEPMRTFAADTRWQLSAPASAADFSAACWIMGRDLQQHQGIAIGLIAASWGGSVIEDWLSAEALGTLPRYRADLALLARYRAAPETARDAWVAALGNWLATGHRGDRAGGFAPVADLRPWEEWGGEWASFDGIARYRTVVRLGPEDLGAARLALGKIDDVDMTRVNGHPVGATAGWDSDRDYALAGNLLQAGDNLIEVTVVDTGGGGGLWGGAPPRALVLANGRSVPLADWQVARGASLAETGVPPALPWVGGSGRTTLFNGMIAPLVDYPLAGFAWYQGEANVHDWAGYAELMPLLIADWRRRFGALPFLMVQLAGYGPLASRPADDDWARLRDVQRRVADADPRVGMASALDVGQVADIHPTDKQSVGHRLALAARAIALEETVEGRGPSPVAAVRGADGIRVRFAHGPLVVVGGADALGFELCASGSCRFVAGHRLAADTILLPATPADTEIRYLWQASPLVNLYNEAGLPATGFRLMVR